MPPTTTTTTTTKKEKNEEQFELEQQFVLRMPAVSDFRSDLLFIEFILFLRVNMQHV
jgi:hypothetical protein